MSLSIIPVELLQKFEIDSSLVLVDAFAPWCGPCMGMMPAIEKLGTALAGALQILKVDVDKHLDLVEPLVVRGVPTLILYKQKNEVWRHSGTLTYEQLKTTMNEFL